MPLYMDRHELQGATPEQLAALHLLDLEVQGRHGVDFVNYWFDFDRQLAFCLARGPSTEAVVAVHRESHGAVANQVIEVDEGAVRRFLGSISGHPPGEAYVDSAFRTILFTDLEGSTRLTHQVGDAPAMTILRRHDGIVREALDTNGGTEVKHTGDGIMASFRSVSDGLTAAVAIQRAAAQAQRAGDLPVGIRIGIAAGEPVEQGGDLFGAVVQLAARLSSRAAPGSILVPTSVRDLAVGDRFRFGSGKSVRLKGFNKPVRAYEVLWQHGSAA